MGQDKNLKHKIHLILDQTCYKNAGKNLKGCEVSQEKYAIPNYDIKSFHIITSGHLITKEALYFCRNLHFTTANVTSVVLAIIILLILIIIGVGCKLKMITCESSKPKKVEETEGKALTGIKTAKKIKNTSFYTCNDRLVVF